MGETLRRLTPEEDIGYRCVYGRIAVYIVDRGIAPPDYLCPTCKGVLLRSRPDLPDPDAAA